MSAILQDLSEPALIHAIEHNLFSFLPFFRFCAQGEIQDGPGLLWSMTNVPFPIFNSIMRARLLAEQVDDAISAVIARGRKRNVPVLWWTGPITSPADLGDALKARGFIQEDDVPGMAMDLRLLAGDASQPEGMEIEFVRNPADLKDWRQAFAESFEMPDFAVDAFMSLFGQISLDEEHTFCHVLARRNGQAAGIGSMFLGAGVAGVYNIGTVPGARRQGIGTLLTLALLREALRLDYRVGVLHSSPMGLGVYNRLGFRQYCNLGQYLWMP